MKNYTPKITFIRIIRKCLPYYYNGRKSYLCLNEKVEIALYEGENLLNKKMELISKKVSVYKYLYIDTFCIYTVSLYKYLYISIYI